jgi:uncharacterized Fe-S cluster protein YjdI/CDGSH-type Zn-finger protein
MLEENAIAYYRCKSSFVLHVKSLSSTYIIPQSECLLIISIKPENPKRKFLYQARLLILMKEYSNQEIIICWQPEKCIHSRECVKGLPQVFNRNQKPWIEMKGASSAEIMRVIDRCPSGALSYRKADSSEPPSVKIKVMKNGPLLVEGDCILVDRDGKDESVKGPLALCRCGGSKKKPFCDGSHAKIDFDDSMPEAEKK